MPLGLSDNLFQRVVSALLLLPPVLWTIYQGDWWFSALLGLGGILMMLEWNKLTQMGGVLAQTCAVLFLLLVVVGLELRAIGGFRDLLILLTILVAGGAFLIRLRQPVGWWFTGLGYVAFPIASLWWVRDFNALLVLWIFLVVWGTDVGGYFAGKGIGGPKLAPKISPKKTWAGLLGGMALSMLASLVMHFVVPFGSSIPILLLLAAILAFWAQVGDLVESGIKRHFGVKDSGGLIPGHGGLLDRVDGLVFVAPAVVFIQQFAPALGFEF